MLPVEGIREKGHGTPEDKVLLPVVDNEKDIEEIPANAEKAGIRLDQQCQGSLRASVLVIPEGGFGEEIREKRTKKSKKEADVKVDTQM